eukprot:3846191-Amphidinium_carterae.1
MWRAFLKRPANRMQLRTINRLSEPRQRTKNTHLGIGVVANTTPPMMRVVTMTTRTIGPNRSDTLPVNHGGFKVPDG